VIAVISFKAIEKLGTIQDIINLKKSFSPEEASVTDVSFDYKKEVIC